MMQGLVKRNAHAALVALLGDGLTTDAPYEIAVENSTVTIHQKG